VNQFKSLSSP